MMTTIVAANNAQNTNNNNNAAAAPPPQTGNARCAHCLSTFTNFAGGLLTLIGACLQQRRYTTTGIRYRTYYDLYFYTFKISPRFGSSTSQDLPDCLKAPYAGGMAMAIIGAAIALLFAIPLSYCAVKYKDSPLRFMRPMALLTAGILALIGAIISGATTDCDGVDLSVNYKLSTGFALLIAGALILLVISTPLSLLQTLTCPDVTPPVPAATMNISGGQSPQMAFASSNTVPQRQQQQAGGAPVYNFASQQQQQPVMGQPVPYNYGAGPGVHQNDPYAASSHQQQPMGYGGQPTSSDPYASGGGNMYATTGNNDIYGGGKSVY